MKWSRFSGWTVAVGATLACGLVAAACGGQGEGPPPPAQDAGPDPITDAGPDPITDAGPDPVTDAGPDPITDAGPDPLPTKPACTHYISPKGSDKGDGSISAPWLTINHASAKLKPGDVLCARGGTYYGQGGYIWHSSGTPAAPIVFENYPGETPIFDGEWNKTGTEGDWIVLSANRWIILDGFTVQHYADQYGNGIVDLVGGSCGTAACLTSDIVIQNCTLQDNGTDNQDHNVYIGKGTANITVRNNFLIRGSGSGVQFWHGPNCKTCEIYNNVFIGGKTQSGANAIWGIVAGDGAQDVAIYNNTFYGMQTAIDLNYDGMDVKGIKNFTITNNIIMNSGTGLKVASFNTSQVHGDYNLWYGNSKNIVWNSEGAGASTWSLAQYQANTPNDQHSLSVNPSLVSPSTNDFHLTAGSPIDKGTSLSLVPYDKDLVSRPQGAAYDIGAYEYH